MAERKRNWNKEDDLPVYLARPGTTAQTPRQKYGGMFASVEGAYENKTIDFDAYSVGKKGSRTPRSGSRHDMLDGGDNYSETASDISEVSGSVISSPGDREDKTPGVEIRYPMGKEMLQGQDNGQVSGAPGQGAGAAAPARRASRAVLCQPSRAVPQSAARRRGGTGRLRGGVSAREVGEARTPPLRHGDAIGRAQLAPKLACLSLVGARPQKLFSFVSDGDEFSPLPSLPVKRCPRRVGWRAARAPRRLPPPPGTKRPPLHFRARRETLRSLSQAQTPALPPTPPAPRVPSLSSRQGEPKAGGPDETFARGFHTSGAVTWVHMVDLGKKWGRWGRPAPASCASPSCLWHTGWRQTREAGPPGIRGCHWFLLRKKCSLAVIFLHRCTLSLSTQPAGCMVCPHSALSIG